MTFLNLAISPCPNDTFTFHALVSGLIKSSHTYSTQLLDIQELNQGVLKEKADISKISFFTLGKILEHYQLLSAGSAMGFHNGPKIVAKHYFPLAELSKKVLGIPGKDTTAYLLRHLFTPDPKKEVFPLYHEIVPLLHRGEIDAGLIIHETRFTLEKEGLVEIADLGELWHLETGLPLPLGCIVGKKSLGEKILDQVTQDIQKSLRHAWDYPLLSQEYIRKHSIEKDQKVIDGHIDLYVNQQSFQLDDMSLKAIDLLLTAGKNFSKGNQLRSFP